MYIAHRHRHTHTDAYCPRLPINSLAIYTLALHTYTHTHELNTLSKIMLHGSVIRFFRYGHRAGICATRRGFAIYGLIVSIGPCSLSLSDAEKIRCECFQRNIVWSIHCIDIFRWASPLPPSATNGLRRDIFRLRRIDQTPRIISNLSFCVFSNFDNIYYYVVEYRFHGTINKFVMAVSGAGDVLESERTRARLTSGPVCWCWECVAFSIVRERIK